MKIYADAYKADNGFTSLSDAINVIGYDIKYLLPQIVRHNLRYRDLARTRGIEHTWQQLVKEAPALCDIDNMFNYLEMDFKRCPIGDHNIFYHPVDCLMFVSGVVFTGLDDLKMSVDITGPATSPASPGNLSRETPRRRIAQRHVAELSCDIPCFDSYDYASDDRRFQNYFVSPEEFTPSQLELICSLPAKFNACKITETIPAAALPAIYYKGEGNVLLIADRRTKTE